MYKVILVPLDGSPLAEAILPHVEALAKSEGAKVTLLRVPVTASNQFISRDPAIVTKILKDTQRQAKRYIESKVLSLSKNAIHVVGIVREGSVPDMIVEVAKEIQADLIAMSTHGRSGLQRILMGSVAEQVVSIAPVPVILFRPCLSS
ncbi:MAG: universal stress protein [Anaerolineales bacterium]|nr:universal stress protein [Anaerolineales bacterium]